MKRPQNTTLTVELLGKGAEVRLRGQEHSSVAHPMNDWCRTTSTVGLRQLGTVAGLGIPFYHMPRR